MTGKGVVRFLLRPRFVDVKIAQHSRKEAAVRRSLSLALCSLLATGSAAAYDLPGPGETVCYGRIYSDVHLQKNPDQLARSLVLELTRWKEYEGLNFWVKVELVDDGLHNWWSTGACNEDDKGVICAVDCDGGSFHLADAKDGGLLLKNDNEGFIVQMECGEEMPEQPAITRLPADKANSLYKLVRLPDDFCPDYEE